VDKLRDELAQLTGKEVGINVEEIKRPELDSQLVATTSRTAGAAHQLPRRMKRACRARCGWARRDQDQVRRRLGR